MRTYDSRGRVPQARLAIGPVLVVGRMSLAVGRGVDFYGLTPVDLATTSTSRRCCRCSSAAGFCTEQ